jgi:phosphoglycolate phosphatase-like HAD superfamily hydrolase
MVIYVDVDDTMIRSVGSKIIPIPSVISKIKSLNAAGVTLYCWSRGGEEYAIRVLDELGIRSCFEKVLSKPDILVDDESLDDLMKKIQMIHPSEFLSYDGPGQKTKDI